MKKLIKFILLEDNPTEFRKYSNLIINVFKNKKYNVEHLFKDYNKVSDLILKYNKYENEAGLYSQEPDKKLYLSSNYRGSLSNVVIFVDIKWRDSGEDINGLNYCKKCLLKEKDVTLDNIIVLTNYGREDKNFDGVKHFVHKGINEKIEIWQQFTGTDVYATLNTNAPKQPTKKEMKNKLLTSKNIALGL